MNSLLSDANLVTNEEHTLVGLYNYPVLNSVKQRGCCY